jgi:hypothetical protein
MAPKCNHTPKIVISCVRCAPRIRTKYQAVCSKCGKAAKPKWTTDAAMKAFEEKYGNET